GVLAVWRRDRRRAVPDQLRRRLRLPPLHREHHWRAGLMTAIAEQEEMQAAPAPASEPVAQPDVDETEIPLVFRVGAIIAFVVLLLPVVIVVLAGLNAGEYLTFPPQGLS